MKLIIVSVLMASSAGATPARLEVQELHGRAAVLTFEVGGQALVPVLSTNGMELSVISGNEIFAIDRVGEVDSIVGDIEQIRESNTNRVVVKFTTPMNVNGESGKGSTRLIAQSVREFADSPRASPQMQLLLGDSAKVAIEPSGVVVTIPEMGSFGHSPLSSILRCVAFGLDWTKSMIPPIWGAQRQVSNEMELQALIRNLNQQVIELRRQIMLKEEELRTVKSAGL